MKLLLLFLLVMTCMFCKQVNYSNYVNPFIGTGGHGHTYPGATVPFGMVQLSPDTRTEGWDACSGYYDTDRSIMGFSHTHLSGTGAADYGDILFMPTIGKLKLKPGTLANPDLGYRSRFQKKNETASPGYYSVHLDDYDVSVELTTTERVGFHKYKYSSDHGNVLIDLQHAIGPDQVINSWIKKTSSNEIVGLKRSKGWAKDQFVYFVAQFSQDINDVQTCNNDLNSNGTYTEGTNVKAVVQFKAIKNNEVLVKVAISAVSIDGARKNLENEIDHWDFKKIKKIAQKKWNAALEKIHIETPSEHQKTIFYTALYHTMLAPNIYMDVDNKYRGMDGKVHTADGFTNYSVFSLWDTFRTLHPLLNIIEYEKNTDFIKTLLKKYDEGGILPIWELANSYTGTMIGYHAIPVIIDAYFKGNRDFDIEKAYKAMKHSAMQNHLGLKYYKAEGLIPADKEHESVSKTLEYAYDDWCIAILAKELGKHEDYEYFIKRAKSYQNMFDPNTGFMRARKNSRWVVPFSPFEVSGDYTEANSWQYTYFVPHDINGLKRLYGNDKSFSKKLDQLFVAEATLSGRDQPDITGLIGQYAHGNEPSHNFAYLYHFTGEAWKTQKLVRQVLDELYTDQPDGLSGNEDCGQMSAWYNMSSLGFYSFNPGQDIYLIGTPLFKSAKMKTRTGEYFIVEAPNVTDKNIYVKSVTLNGKPLTKTYIRHKDIENGGVLHFEMSDKPNKKWGKNKSDRPPSSVDYKIVSTPYIETGSKSFHDKRTITLKTITEDSEIRFTLDGSIPTSRSQKYVKPFDINESTKVNAIAYKKNFSPSFIMKAEFVKIPYNRKIQLNTNYSHLYTAGGDLGLIDALKGGENFKNGWQGYEGINLDAVIDLGDIKEVKRISTGFLQMINAWIFMPENIRYYASDDGKSFKEIAMIETSISPKNEDLKIHRFQQTFKNVKGRYIKIIAKNMGRCPDWHKGAGGKSWIFADEIEIDTSK